MRIKQLIINAFRGIPNTLSINFPIKNNKPTSLIILGDNGVGKSSIVDAIELCLQCQISQTQSFANQTFPSLLTMSNNNLPDISIVFENDEICNRYVINFEGDILLNIKYPQKDFAISPFVLRRHDILRFINSSEAERTLVFSNYLRDEKADSWQEFPKDELVRLQDDRLKLKKERNRLISQLAQELKIDEKEIPLEIKIYKTFVNNTIYKNIPKSAFEKKGIKVKINEKSANLAHNLLKILIEYKKIKGTIRSFSVNNFPKKFPKHLLTQLEEFLVKVEDKLNKSFLEISQTKFINKLEIKYDNSSAIAMSVNVILKNGMQCRPNQILSEANLDLLALLFFLSFIQESAERGQAKLLILDDVLQSIDATIRVNFITFLLKNLPEWQYIITVHDRLWHRQLIDLMNAYGHQYSRIQIVDWSFERGPIIDLSTTTIEESLFLALENNDWSSICSNSGLLLEQICDSLSKNLNTTIKRKKDDKYTLGDLWPGIAKILKKTPVKEQVESVEKWIHLRNLIGAHYNEWALSLSLEEAKSFGYAVMEFYNSVMCSKCSHWLFDNPDLMYYSCKCGKLQYPKK